MRTWRRTRRSPIGVEVTPSRVRLLQVEWRGEEGRVIASADLPRRVTETEGLAPDDVAEVRRALREEGFRGRDCVPGLPCDQAVLRHVKVEAVAGQALADALLFELEDAFPGDTPLVQHLEVGEVVERGERRHELILLAAGLERVDAYVRGLAECGLNPLAVDAEGCALIRCFMRRRRRSGDAEVHNAIVHLGEAATLMVITGAGQPLFMKLLPIGAAQFHEAIAQRLDLRPEELRHAADDGEEELAARVVAAVRLPLDSLSLELSACLRYHAASRRSPGGVDLFLSGAGANVPGFAGALAEALNTTVSRPDPFTAAFSAVEPDERVRRDFAAWTIPLGLLLRDEAA